MKCHSEHIDGKKIGRKRYLFDSARKAKILQSARRNNGNRGKKGRKRFDGEKEMKEEKKEQSFEERMMREMEMEDMEEEHSDDARIR